VLAGGAQLSWLRVLERRLAPKTLPFGKKAPARGERYRPHRERPTLAGQLRAARDRLRTGRTASGSSRALPREQSPALSSPVLLAPAGPPSLGACQPALNRTAPWSRLVSPVTANAAISGARMAPRTCRRQSLTHKRSHTNAMKQGLASVGKERSCSLIVARTTQRYSNTAHAPSLQRRKLFGRSRRFYGL
jgi:hypothetical protein